MSITWTNEQRKLSDLQPWPRNPRQIKNAQAERLLDSVDTFGQVETLAIGPNGEVYNGHQRLQVLMQEHGPDFAVDVRVSSRPLTEKEREKLTVYLHKGAAGEWDFDVLANEFELDDLLDWGFEAFELGLDEDDATTPGEDTEPQIDKAEELRQKWGVETGQLWQLGEHRLICGDCTDAEVVARVMGGEKADAVVTDPPYGVIDEKWDRLPNQGDLDIWMSNSTGAIMAFGSAPPKAMIALLSLSPIPERILCWWNTFTLTSSEGTFWQWQPIYLWRKSSMHGLERDVIDMAANTGGDKLQHVTQKPTKLIERLLASCVGAKLYFEPFCGSGTTIIACENLNRRCRAVEISPGYVAVTLERWHQHTGKTPVLIDD